MATLKRFEDLDVWKLGREFCRKIGSLIDNNFEKDYRLIGQIEDSSGSIKGNIAEGFERGTKNEFIVFLGYAKASCGELSSQLYRALDRNYITQLQVDLYRIMAVRFSAMIQKFIAYLQQTNIKGKRKRETTP